MWQIKFSTLLLYECTNIAWKTHCLQEIADPLLENIQHINNDNSVPSTKLYCL